MSVGLRAWALACLFAGAGLVAGCTGSGHSTGDVRPTAGAASPPGVAQLSVSPPPLVAVAPPRPGERAGSAVELKVTSALQNTLLRVGARSLHHAPRVYRGVQVLVYTADRRTKQRYAAGYLRVGKSEGPGGVGSVGGARYELFTRSPEGVWTMRIAGDYGPPASRLRPCAPGLPRDVKRLWRVAPGACEPDP
jgi:hypothetical protein